MIHVKEIIKPTVQSFFLIPLSLGRNDSRASTRPKAMETITNTALKVVSPNNASRHSLSYNSKT